MNNQADLKRILQRIDGRGYKAYKDIQGAYRFDQQFTLYIDHVQGDPFASPSKLRIRLDQSTAGLPDDLFQNRTRRIALQDFLARATAHAIKAVARGHRGTGKGGLIYVDAGAQEVIERTAVLITPQWLELRLQLGLPAAGRRVLAREAEEMLIGELPRIADRALLWSNTDQTAANNFVNCIENQESIRAQLRDRNLAAFVANGSVLPRTTGASDKPLTGNNVVPFQAPDSLTVTLPVPNPIPPNNQKELTGMGIPIGITLIVGGGYHGKSTLLKALERGVYPHIPGDGREYVVTDPDAVKIRAEDGRRVERVDIAAFIRNLPQGRGTNAFCSDDASGSTSQAANIIEAIETGARILLLDEDTSATNFMVRDARMQALVNTEFEPITPFVDRVQELYDRHKVSSIVVMGGCGDYFDVADTVIMMREFTPLEVTAKAKDIARSNPTNRAKEANSPIETVTPRIPQAASFDASRGRRDVKIDAKARDLILYGSEPIDLRYVEQLVDYSQTQAIGYAIHLATERLMDGHATMHQVVTNLEELLNEEGLDILDPFRRGDQHPGNFALPRRHEIAAAINRLRTVRMK